MKSNDFLSEGIVEDAHEMHQDHEVQMAREECYHAAGDAIALHKLLKHVSEQQGIEGWVAAKVTLAADYLKTVREYLEYELMSGHQTETGSVQEVLPVAEGVITADDFKTITEVNPHDFDSDEDYYNALKAKPRVHSGSRGSSSSYRHPEDTDFMDPVERRLRADQERVRQAWAAHNAKKTDTKESSYSLALPVRQQTDTFAKHDDETKELGDVSQGGPWKRYHAKKKAEQEKRKKQQSVAEGKGDFAQAIGNLHGWYEETSKNPNLRIWEFDDREGGFYAQGEVIYNTQTGRVKVKFDDRSGQYGDDIDQTFDSMGDALNALRTLTTQINYNTGKAQNFDRLGHREPVGPDSLRKTDRTGRKGTLAGRPTNNLKYSIQHNKGRHGPKGVLPEQGVAEGGEWTKLPNGNWRNMHTGVQQSTPPKKSKPRVGNRMSDISIGSPKIVHYKGKAVGEVGLDHEASPGNGPFYMKHYLTGKDMVGYATKKEALADLKHMVMQHEGLAEDLESYSSFGTKVPAGSQAASVGGGTSTLPAGQVAYNQLRGQVDTLDTLQGGGKNTYTDRSTDVAASQNAMRQKLGKMEKDLAAKGINARADYDAPEQVKEMSAGSIATVVNPTPKNKAKVGTLFGGTYKQKKAK